MRQVTGAVRWVDCVQALKSAGAEFFVEVGPGKVLCGLLKQIDPALKCAERGRCGEPGEDAGGVKRKLLAISYKLRS